MKPGRNDPCPCGSGKKYKHCCLRAAQAEVADARELVWRRLRRWKDEDGFATQMLRFVRDAYGAQALDEAWAEFTLWEEEPFDRESPHLPLFMPWLFSQWAPGAQDTAVADSSLHDTPPLRAYLRHKGRTLDPLMREYLEDCLASPFSFYEVQSSEPGRALHLREAFTGETCEVLERSASQTLQAGDLLFGQVAGAQGVNLLEACSPVVIPPIHKLELIELRQTLERASSAPPRERLREYAAELREVYWDLAEALLHPQMPQLKTTDGEDLVLHKLVFDIESAQAAFDALKDLDFQTSEAELLENAERAPDGRLVRVSLDWKKPGNALHAQWSNTILGHIAIEGRRMTVEVNSNERAVAFRRLVEERLGARARYRMSEVQSADKLLTQATGTPALGKRGGAGADAPSPELQAVMQEYLARYYDEWLDQAIPALGGATPRQAVQTPDGREKVEALLRDFERRGPASGQDPAIFRRLRQRLGLADA
ncbi:MAG: SEC-C domain-containing protein [Sinobacteraceae bacterium]|nr:SEC-C domain-containing protein [Nevskiaceae bacterium]